MKEIILCVDDEEDLLELLEFNLEKAGYEVIGCLNCKIAKRFIENENISLILMDRKLPKEDGLHFVKDIKKIGYNTPVIFLTALSLPQDRVNGLSIGDDYVSKPFNFEELVARIQAVLRRYNKDQNIKLKYRNIVLNTKSKELLIDDTSFDLSPLESRIMTCFLQNAGQVLSREFLLENAWDSKSTCQENSVNVAIKRLRKKVFKEGGELKIKSIRSEGYKLC